MQYMGSKRFKALIERWKFKSAGELRDMIAGIRQNARDNVSALSPDQERTVAVIEREIQKLER